MRNRRAPFAVLLTVAVLIVSGSVAFGYTFVGPYLDNVWGRLYTHSPRVCDGGTFTDDQAISVFSSQCYNFNVQDTPSADQLITTWINWGHSAPAVIFGPPLVWGPVWVLDLQNGSNTQEYFDWLCHPFPFDESTPDYYKRTTGGLYNLPSSVEQYVWGACPPGQFGISMYEELQTYTH